MRGTAPMKVGRTAARLSTILSTRPSIAVANPTISGSASITLPNECASGSHKWFRSSGPKMFRASTAAAVYVHASWVNRTPFGLPVVPEV